MPKRTCCIYHRDIQIAVNTPVLKSVIHQNDFSTKFFYRHVCGRDAVGILHVRNLRQPCR